MAWRDPFDNTASITQYEREHSGDREGTGNDPEDAPREVRTGARRRSRLDQYGRRYRREKRSETDARGLLVSSETSDETRREIGTELHERLRDRRQRNYRSE